MSMAGRVIDRTNRRTTKAAVSQTYSIPSPTGGINAVDSLAMMPESDAIILENFFPQPSYVELRNGSENWASGLPGVVETLVAYNGTSGGHKLFGFSNGAIYNCTSKGAVSTPVVTGLSNSQWEYTNVATPGGEFIMAGNATDNLLLYDGSAWTSLTGSSSPAITGIDTKNLRNPVIWKSRVWFVQDGTLNAWYLPTSSIAGVAEQFPLVSIFQHGGNLQAIFTASLSNGSTFDDYICFYTTEGEIALYAGTDPDEAGLFNLQGIFRVGRPIGRRCFFHAGADVILICSDGFVSLSKLITAGRINQQDAISYKILQLVNADVQSYRTNFGWQGILYPLGNKILVNVPQTQGLIQYQYVMNTISNSWCKFTAWNASCFCVSNDVLYYGTSGKVVVADTGNDDNGADIVGKLKTAFSYFKTDQRKAFRLCRPIVQSDGAVSAAISVNVDFEDIPPTLTPSFSPPTGSLWNVSLWNVTPWKGSLDIQKGWLTISGLGFCASFYLTISIQNVLVRLQAVDYLYEPGGIL